MKLRIRGNSIRLRLRAPEVARIATGESLESVTDFGSTSLRFSLVGKFTTALSASFSDNAIVVVAPQEALAAWAAGDEVGIYGEQATSGGESLTIAVEKDFRCLDRTHADDNQAGTYPHPKINTVRS